MNRFEIPHLIGGRLDGTPLPEARHTDELHFATPLRPQEPGDRVPRADARAGYADYARVDVYKRRHVGPLYGWVFDDPNDWNGVDAGQQLMAAVIELAKKGVDPPALEDNASSVLGYPAELILRMEDGPIQMPLPVSTDAYGGEPRFNWRDAAEAIDAWRLAGKR